MISTLPQEIVHRSTAGGVEEGFAGVGVVKRHLARGRGSVRLVQEFSQRPEVAGILGVVPIEVADPISDVAIALPSQILLNGHAARSVGFFAHDGLRAHDRGGWIVGSCWHHKIAVGGEQFSGDLTHE